MKKIKVLHVSHAASGNINPEYSIIVVYEERE